MGRPGWYNDNAHRAFPFLDTPGAGLPLPESAVVDFGCVIGAGVGYDDRAHKIFLHRVSRSGNTFSFVFKSDAPGLDGVSLSFTRSLHDPEYTTSFAAAAKDSGEQFSDSCGISPLWEGFLVTGDLTDLAGVLGDGESIVDWNGNTVIEPALVQNLDSTFVQSVNLANEDRTRCSPPEDCRESSHPGPEEETRLIYVNKTCMTGHIPFIEGYNCLIRQNVQENAIIIGGAVGAGKGEPCEEVPLFSSEAPPEGSKLLSGGPACDEIVKTINGVGGRVVRLYPGPGTKIVPGHRPGQIIVNVDLGGLALCYRSESSQSSASGTGSS